MSEEEKQEPSAQLAVNENDSDYRTLAQGYLSPRHRRLAQLAASGMPNGKIAEELGYADSRVSILLKNPYIQEEILRLQEKIFEETIQQRLKSFSDIALNNIHFILSDRTNKVKVSEKLALSTWLIEKLDGKAKQNDQANENLLSTIMDRLDSRGHAPKQIVNLTQNIMNNYAQTQNLPPDQPKDVTPAQIQGKTAEELAMEEWISDFNASSQEK